MKLRRMLWRLLASLLLFVLFMKVLSLSSSSSFVLLPMRNEDAWYSVRVLSWKLGKENPLPVTVRTTVAHSFICDSPRLQGRHPVLKAVVWGYRSFRNHNVMMGLSLSSSRRLSSGPLPFYSSRHSLTPYTEFSTTYLIGGHPSPESEVLSRPYSNLRFRSRLRRPNPCLGHPAFWFPQDDFT